MNPLMRVTGACMERPPLPPGTGRTQAGRGAKRGKLFDGQGLIDQFTTPGNLFRK
jgi:hypothetical protein